MNTEAIQAQLGKVHEATLTKVGELTKVRAQAAEAREAKKFDSIGKALASVDQLEREVRDSMRKWCDLAEQELLALAISLAPDAILLPKVDAPRDLLEVNDALDEADAPESTKLWAMIETPRGMLNIGAIAELGRDPSSRLACFVAGTNDLVKDTGVLATPDRRYLMPWLMQMVLAARAGGIDVLDGVSNDFRDLDAFARECADAAGSTKGESEYTARRLRELIEFMELTTAWAERAQAMSPAAARRLATLGEKVFRLA